jgi:hypothetical protein
MASETSHLPLIISVSIITPTVVNVASGKIDILVLHAFRQSGPFVNTFSTSTTKCSTIFDPFDLFLIQNKLHSVLFLSMPPLRVHREIRWVGLVLTLQLVLKGFPRILCQKRREQITPNEPKLVEHLLTLTNVPDSQTDRHKACVRLAFQTFLEISRVTAHRNNLKFIAISMQNRRGGFQAKERQ